MSFEIYESRLRGIAHAATRFWHGSFSRWYFGSWPGSFSRWYFGSLLQLELSRESKLQCWAEEKEMEHRGRGKTTIRTIPRVSQLGNDFSGCSAACANVGRQLRSIDRTHDHVGVIASTTEGGIFTEAAADHVVAAEAVVQAVVTYCRRSKGVIACSTERPLLFRPVLSARINSDRTDF